MKKNESIPASENSIMLTNHENHASFIIHHKTQIQEPYEKINIAAEIRQRTNASKVYYYDPKAS